MHMLIVITVCLYNYLIMVALCNRADHYIFALLLWPPYVIGQTIIFLPCYFYLLLLSFFSSPNLSGRRLDVYHTLVRGVALVRI